MSKWHAEVMVAREARENIPAEALDSRLRHEAESLAERQGVRLSGEATEVEWIPLMRDPMTDAGWRRCREDEATDYRYRATYLAEAGREEQA